MAVVETLGDENKMSGNAIPALARFSCIGSFKTNYRAVNSNAYYHTNTCINPIKNNNLGDFIYYDHLCIIQPNIH